MGERREVILAELLQNKGYIRGPFGSALKRPEMKSEGIPVYEQQHAIYNSREFRFYIDEKKFEELKRFQVKNGDIVISCSGTVGKVTIIKEDDPKGIISQALLILRVDESKVLPEYLKYFFSSQEGYNAIVSRSSGSVQVNISKREVIEQIPISLPTISEQEKIVSILKSIDDKVQTNSAINRNLQEQLKAIFDAWFYKMEPFGGEEPKGTEYIPLEKLCVAVTKGTTPTTLGMSFTDEGINFIKGETILDNHGFDRSKLSFISEDTHEKLKRSQIENGDIVFTIAGTLGRFALVDESMIPANTNQAVAIIRSKCIAPEYLYSFFLGNWHNDYYIKRIQQAVQANLSLGTIKSLPIAVLPKVYYKEYLDIIKPLIRETKRIEAENMKLIELRDSLLPRLMSGELDVSDLNI